MSAPHSTPADAGPVEAAETSCVLIPVRGHSLLLPNVSVAEILPWRRLQPRPDAPAWLHGVLSWRGQSLPVLAPEVIHGGAAAAAPSGARATLLVMNRSRPLAGLAFYALLAAELPRLVHAAAEDLQDDDADSLPPAALATVRLGTEIALVPDVSVYEDLAQQLTPVPRAAPV